MKQTIKKLLNDVQRAAFEIGITRSDTKAHKAARANMELTETALDTIYKELDQNCVKLALSGERDSAEVKEMVELKNSIDRDTVAERESIGIDDAAALKRKSTNAEMIAFRKAYSKDKNLYKPEVRMLDRDGERAMKALKYYHDNNVTERIEGATNKVENIIAGLRNLHDGEADTLAMAIENSMREIVGEPKFELTITTFNPDTYLAESTEHRKFSNLTGALAYDAEVKASGILHNSKLFDYATELTPFFRNTAGIEYYYNKQGEDISRDEFLKIYGSTDTVVEDSQQIEEADAPFTAEETALFDTIEKATFDNIVYQHGNHEKAHQAAIDGDVADTKLGELAIIARKNGDDEHFKLLCNEKQARINHAAVIATEKESAAGQYIRGELTYQPLGNHSIFLEQLETEISNKMTKLDASAETLKSLKTDCQRWATGDTKTDYKNYSKYVDFERYHDPNYSVGTAISYIGKAIEQVEDFKTAIADSNGVVVKVKSNPDNTILYHSTFVDTNRLKVTKSDKPMVTVQNGGVARDFDVYEINFDYVEELAEKLVESAKNLVPDFVKNVDLQSAKDNKPVFSKSDYANGIANAVSNLSSKRRRWDIYTIKNAANLKGFIDVRDAAQKVLDEGFDAFTVGDYLRLTA